MGEITHPKPVLLILAAFSRHEAALDWTEQVAADTWGPIAMKSDRFVFEDTSYYEKTMGAGLRKGFLAFEKLIDPSEIVEIKRFTNHLEETYRDSHDWPDERPLNLDPGYIAEAKLILATTKDRDHRIYLGSGIYAEGTLHYRGGRWQTRPWTYPDYQRTDYQQFFSSCRTYLRERYRTQA